VRLRIHYREAHGLNVAVHLGKKAGSLIQKSVTDDAEIFNYEKLLLATGGLARRFRF
jgi:hypothetical protein